MRVPELRQKLLRPQQHEQARAVAHELPQEVSEQFEKIYNCSKIIFLTFLNEIVLDFVMLVKKKHHRQNEFLHLKNARCREKNKLNMA